MAAIENFMALSLFIQGSKTVDDSGVTGSVSRNIWIHPYLWHPLSTPLPLTNSTPVHYRLHSQLRNDSQCMRLDTLHLTCYNMQYFSNTNLGISLS